MERVLSWVKPAAVSGYRHPRLDGGCGGRSASIGADSRLFPDTAKKKKKRGDQAVEEPITERPEPLPELELANLQGVGSREEQQDAFGISRMDRYEEDGLLAVPVRRHGRYGGGRHESLRKLPPPSWWGSFLGQMTAMCPAGYTSEAPESTSSFAGTGGLPWWRPCSKRIASPSGA